MAATATAIEAMVRLLHHHPVDQTMERLKGAVVTIVLAAEIALERGYVGEDGVDDGLLEGAMRIRDLVDPGVS